MRKSVYGHLDQVQTAVPLLYVKFNLQSNLCNLMQYALISFILPHIYISYIIHTCMPGWRKMHYGLITPSEYSAIWIPEKVNTKLIPVLMETFFFWKKKDNKDRFTINIFILVCTELVWIFYSERVHIIKYYIYSATWDNRVSFYVGKWFIPPKTKETAKS